MCLCLPGALFNDDLGWFLPGLTMKVSPLTRVQAEVQVGGAGWPNFWYFILVSSVGLVSVTSQRCLIRTAVTTVRAISIQRSLLWDPARTQGHTHGSSSPALSRWRCFSQLTSAAEAQHWSQSQHLSTRAASPLLNLKTSSHL